MENIVLYPIPLHELKKVISDTVLDALKNHNDLLAHPEPVIVDGETIEKKFGITRQTLARWRDQGKIPYLQGNGVIRYDLHKVIEALETPMKNRNRLR